MAAIKTKHDGGEKGSAGKGRLRLREYPYTYTRVSVMKSSLIKPDMYSKLLKMKLSEIAKFMQETEYKKEIDEFGSRKSGISLIEQALSMNLVRTFTKLKRICEDDSLRELISAYMIRNDVWNIKTLIRGKHSGQKKEDIAELIMPFGTLSEDTLSDLAQKESVDEIIKRLDKAGFIALDNIKAAAHSYREKKLLFELENALDKDHYSYLISFSRRMPKQGELFRRFIENEIDMLNLRIILRMKKEGLDKKLIAGYLLQPGARLTMRELKEMISSEDLGFIPKMLASNGYNEIARELREMKDRKSVTDLELKITRFLLHRQIMLLHQNPLSVDVILGYMFAKEIEIRNLRTIIKGKQLGLSEDFIQGQLVMGGMNRGGMRAR